MIMNFPKSKIFSSHKQSRNNQMTPQVQNKNQEINLLTMSRSRLETFVTKKYSTSSNL